MKAKQRKTLERIGGTLLSIVDKLDFEGRFDLLRLVRVWPEVVGDTIARRTEVAGLKFHVAVVRVSNTMWIQELSLMRTQILQRLQAKIGNDSIRDIRFVRGALSRRARPRLRSVPRPARHAVKLPDIKDPALRRAFEDLVEAWGRSSR